MATNTTRFKQLAPRMIRDLMRDFAPLADFQAAGVAGNGGGESGGFTIAQEGAPTSGRGGWGPFQWTGPRRVAYEQWIKDHGRNPGDPNAALDYDLSYGFLKHELQTSEKATIPALRQAKTIAEATKAFMVKFERPGVPHYESRVKWSQMALDAYMAEQGKISKDPPVVKQTGQVTENAPVDGIPRPKETKPAGFWGTLLGGAAAAATAVYNYALAWLPTLVIIAGLILVGIYVLRPVYLRWRDHLQFAPELMDAPFKTKLAILFDGFKIRVLSRLTEGVSALAAAASWASSLAGLDGLGIDNLLPAIPLGEVKIVASQYLIAFGILVGRLNDYLRSKMNVPIGVIDPMLAASAAAESEHIIGNTPSPALMSVVAPSTGIEQFVTHTEPVVVRKRAKKKKKKKTGRR
jgi:hypothetical protein